MAGYSSTPLVKKLGLQSGAVAVLVDAPAGFVKQLEPVAQSVTFVTRLSKRVEFVHGFFTDAKALEALLQRARKTCSSEVVLWVSWPKKASGVPTTVTENTIRALALPLGFVDVKVCAVDEVWSGLKLVVRTELR